ncbi:GNAT family N-acetyltransferase [Nocardioides sp.]|uniref:GNAT family N-acetyltransferase n=1 Tax=Nocardioides sp. TaxID=35761 RepID=UPI003782ED13
MTSLDRPDVRLRPSWAEAVAEFTDAGEVMHGSGLWDFDPLDTSAAGAARVLEHPLGQADPANVAEGLVPCTFFWITDGEGDDRSFVGYLALRHALTPRLLEEGGNIGYAVRPSRRGEGHATRALELALVEAAALGLDRVLLTADDDNVASWRVMEHVGAVHEDTRGEVRRYWIRTTPEMV